MINHSNEHKQKRIIKSRQCVVLRRFGFTFGRCAKVSGRRGIDIRGCLVVRILCFLCVGLFRLMNIVTFAMMKWTRIRMKCSTNKLNENKLNFRKDRRNFSTLFFCRENFAAAHRCSSIYRLLPVPSRIMRHRPYNFRCTTKSWIFIIAATRTFWARLTRCVYRLS